MSGHRKHVFWLSLGIGSLLVVVGFMLSLSIGAKAIPMTKLWEILINGHKDLNDSIIMELRLPRAIAALLVGGYLAMSGAMLQGVTRNPIAEPSIMGITQGATLAIAVAFALQRHFNQLVLSPFMLMCLAFLGASISGLLVYKLCSRRGTKVSTVKLALAGTALGTLLISLASGIAILTNLSQQLGFWLSGGFTTVTWKGVALLALVGLSTSLAALLMAPKITVMSLGEEVAIGLGQKTDQIRLGVIFLVILLTGTSVSVAGNIVFVGLIIPQIVKALVGGDYGAILPVSFIFGAALVLFGDVLARCINPPYETPIGALTALIGVPIYIYLIRKEQF